MHAALTCDPDAQVRGQRGEPKSFSLGPNVSDSFPSRQLSTYSGRLQTMPTEGPAPAEYAEQA